MSHTNPPSDNPLFVAIDDLRDFDSEWIRTHPKSADAGLQRRLRQLRLAVAAVVELQSRDEEVTAASTEKEMQRLHDEFSFRPSWLLDLAHELHLDEDLERAHTVELAYYTMMLGLLDQLL